MARKPGRPRRPRVRPGGARRTPGVKGFLKDIFTRDPLDETQRRRKKAATARKRKAQVAKRKKSARPARPTREK